MSQPPSQLSSQPSRPCPENRSTAGTGLTLAACAVVLAVTFAVLARLTAGFECWTFETRRRHDAAAGRLAWPAMALQDATGQTLSLPPLGPVLLVDFIYTNCASVCQSAGAAFYQAQQQVQRTGADIRLMSLSIDPARDTPPALAAYARLHRADPRTWTVAVPASPDEGRRARQALGVIAVDDGSGGFVHNGALHVVARDGRVAGIFDTADWPQALALAERLAAARP